AVVLERPAAEIRLLNARGTIGRFVKYPQRLICFRDAVRSEMRAPYAQLVAIGEIVLDRRLGRQLQQVQNRTAINSEVFRMGPAQDHRTRLHATQEFEQRRTYFVPPLLPCPAWTCQRKTARVEPFIQVVRRSPEMPEVRLLRIEQRDYMARG